MEDSFCQRAETAQENSRGLAIDIQHIGSTAIPGIVAKPIIDISLGLRRMVEAKKLAKHLSPLGYIWRRTFLRPEKHMLFVKGPESKRTHYLHVMKYDGRIWKNDVLFRNSLRRSPARAKEYEAIKITLAKKFFSQRGSYTKGKERFIRQTLKMAER